LILRGWHSVAWLPILLIGLCGCVEIDSETELAEDEVRWGLPSQEFEDVTLVYSNAGEKNFQLTAPHLDRFDRKERAFFYGGIEILFYEEGEISSELTSESGEVLRDGEELIAIGNVVVTTDTGTTILTPRIRWDRETKMITNDTTVTIITEYDTLRGTGLIATDDLKMKRIINPTGVSHRSSNEEGGSGGGLLLSPRKVEDETPSRRRTANMTVVGPSGSEPPQDFAPAVHSDSTGVADSTAIDTTVSEPAREGDQ
jgi:LPS export ABC transporter protein LptC